MEMLQIKKTEICAGLGREYKLFQISDMHMACLDNESSELDKADRVRAGRWIEMKREFADSAGELCDERYDVEADEIFPLLTQYALDIKADALILSGDIFDRITESNLRYLKRFLAEYPLPVIYCFGNHDSMNEAGEYVNQYERFEGIVDSPECDAICLDGLKVVTIDNGTKKITDKQIAFLEEQLKGEQKFLLVLHAPLNVGEFGKGISEKLSPYFLQGVNGDSENAFKFNEIVKNNSDKIIAVLAGHIHRFYEGRIDGDLWQLTCSSGLIGAGREIIIK